MENIFLLVVSFLAGQVLRRSGRMPENTPAVLNSFIIHISLPALVLLHIHELNTSPGWLLPALMPWLVFLAGFLFFLLLKALFGFSRQIFAALLLSSALGNTSFVGLPMIEAYYGHEAVGIGIVADQLGTFLTMSLPGIMAIAWLSAGKVSAGQIVRRIVWFAPFQALLLALLLRPWPYPPLFESILQHLGDTLPPLALFSVGYLLRLSQIKGKIRYLFMGLGYKLLLAPLFIFLVYRHGFSLSGQSLQVTVFEAAMAPMVTSTILVMESKLAPELAALLLGLGIPLSFGSLYLWQQWLQAF